VSVCSAPRNSVAPMMAMIQALLLEHYTDGCRALPPVVHHASSSHPWMSSLFSISSSHSTVTVSHSKMVVSVSEECIPVFCDLW
jgi:hypothetical protein